MSYASFAQELRKWWSFDDRQIHTHSWHSREDFIKDKMRELIDAETKPLHVEIERLQKALSPFAKHAHCVNEIQPSRLALWSAQALNALSRTEPVL